MSEHWIWGIDLSTTYMDIAVVDQAGAFQCNACITPPHKTLPERLSVQRQAVREFSASMAFHFPPLAVYVELPTGHFPNPPLMMSCGAVLAGLHEGLAGTPFPVGIHHIPVKSWKKSATGFGTATKAQVLEWAQGLGYAGSRQDGADALGVAHFGCWETQRALPSRPYSPA